MKSRTVQCMKFFLTGFNIICILFAILVVAICALDLRAQRKEPEERSNMSAGAAGFLIALGVLLAAAAVVGIVGALREGTKTLYTYAGLLLALVCVEVTVGVGAAVLRAWSGGGGGAQLRQQFFRNVTADDARHHAAWDRTQVEFECCGVDGPGDYSVLHRDVPASCCPRAHPLRAGRERSRLHALCLQERQYYADGCDAKIVQSVNRLANLYIGIGVFFGLIEVLCTVLSLWMAHTVRMERKKLQQNLQSHFES